MPIDKETNGARKAKDEGGEGKQKVKVKTVKSFLNPKRHSL